MQIKDRILVGELLAKERYEPDKGGHKNKKFNRPRQHRVSMTVDVQKTVLEQFNDFCATHPDLYKNEHLDAAIQDYIKKFQK